MAKADSFHRRQAVMLASQLPEGAEDCAIIMRLLQQLVTDFLTAPPPTKRPGAVVVRIGGNDDRNQPAG